MCVEVKVCVKSLLSLNKGLERAVLHSASRAIIIFTWKSSAVISPAASSMAGLRFRQGSGTMLLQYMNIKGTTPEGFGCM